jgi:hypothetical protein
LNLHGTFQVTAAVDPTVAFSIAEEVVQDIIDEPKILLL